MRSLESASSSWQDLKQYRSLDNLREATRIEGRSSAVASAGLRSAAWKAFLLLETLDTSTWPKTLASSRSAYDSLRMHFLQQLENQDEVGNDEKNAHVGTEPAAFETLKQNEDLRAEIQQDVDRCMPENLYFRQPETQQMLLDILFVFCKLNPDISYRQGMHELLAPILWVVERDAVDLGQSSKAHGEDVVVRAVFSSEHIEHDAFALFSQLMHSAKNFYEQTTHSGRENPMVLRSQRIMSDLLAKADPDLSQHLDTIGILPQIFLLRWIRLLFGREFPFDDVLTMWDVMFAEDTSLELVDYVCLAMILRIRWELIESDYNTAIALLLRYPQPHRDHPAQSFVIDALYLRDHLSTEGSGYLILKYTGRPLMPTDRPATPPALQRNITNFSGANAAKAAAAAAGGLRPQNAFRQKANIESLMQSTAKNIYARGESLGIGKAVRNAVDEVHKRAQEIRDTQTPSLPPRAPHGGHGALYGKIKSLEARNAQLSKLLHGAVNELWDYQKLVAEKEKKPDESGPSHELEQLSMAIAKAQFVQVYLSDPSLPLSEPDAEASHAANGTEQGNAAKTAAEKSPAPGDRGARQESQLSKTDTVESESTFALADPSTFEDDDDSLASTPTYQSTATAAPTSPSDQPVSHDDTEINIDPSSPQSRSNERVTRADRPALAESSFSWMLDQEQPPEKPPASKISPKPDQGRSRGILFGEQEEIDASPTQVKRASGRGRKQKVPATKVPTGDAADVGDLR
ncbi:hypothetical protein NU195Hw_g9107t1 [Hortaea werneckii]